jgi:hypothetical protein
MGGLSRAAYYSLADPHASLFRVAHVLCGCFSRPVQERDMLAKRAADKAKHVQDLKDRHTALAALSRQVRWEYRSVCPPPFPPPPPCSIIPHLSSLI